MTELIRNEYHPDSVTPPGDTVAEMLEFLGMTQTELARRTGRPVKTINEIVKGKSSITPETALQFEKVLGVSARFWNNSEKLYQESLARITEIAAMRKLADWAASFPVKEMVRNGWIPKAESTEDRVRSLLQFFGVASPDQYKEIYGRIAVSFRKSQKVKSNPEALAAWLHQGTRDARGRECAEFDSTSFRHALDEIRYLTTEPPEVFELQMKELCAQSGVILAFVRELPGAPVNGAARWLTKDRALIQLSLRYKCNDIFWFSFFHEAAHILLHRKRMSFIDLPKEVGNGSTQEEREANAFAANLLIPVDRYEFFIEEQHFSSRRVQEFANKIGIAPGIVVGRLQHDGCIPFKNLNGLKSRFEWTQ